MNGVKTAEKDRTTTDNKLFCSTKVCHISYCFFTSNSRLWCSKNKLMDDSKHVWKKKKKKVASQIWLAKDELKPFWFADRNHISVPWHFSISVKPAVCHLAATDPWLHISCPNGLWTLAWGTAWQKPQRGAAALRYEPPSPGPGGGSSWSPGAFLQLKTAKHNSSAFYF